MCVWWWWLGGGGFFIIFLSIYPMKYNQFKICCCYHCCSLGYPQPNMIPLQYRIMTLSTTSSFIHLFILYDPNSTRIMCLISLLSKDHFKICCFCCCLQTDFDDGHCPSWGNQLHGLHNVYKAVHNMLPGERSYSVSSSSSLSSSSSSSLLSS